MKPTPAKDLGQVVKSSLGTHRTIVTRFAPSPTGYLHLGHVASALFVWGLARAVDARVLLRIEDHDRQRSKTAFEEAIFFELGSLGFVSQSTEPGSLDVYSRQSNQVERYEKALRVLRQNHNVYHCDCTRKEIIASMGGSSDQELCYDGRCRNRRLDPQEGRTGIRIEMMRHEIVFDDLGVGRQTQVPLDQCGDLLLKDKKGNWTYHFSNVVDDLEDGVNLVIRGEDLLSSTGRQIQLRRALGVSEDPVYFHHPLIYESHGEEKLSKRIRSESISEMLSRGVRAEEILGKAAFLAGLKEDSSLMGCDEAQSFFS